ncbi:MAG: polysaccharide biosynthesis C-terminal domain-containing protein [Muribaculaceae bacterium]|nr:polysaccharide biosynthesis C-terminal domain-containing protein [Muribaculaceae bacterium]
MSGIKSLAKDTAIYGVSSIVGRFLNWMLVPLYTNMFPVAEYGVVTLVYAVVALALVILTYGMETGFFRFANHERWSDPMEVYSTSLISLAVSSTAFIALVAAFLPQAAAALECPGRPSFVMIMAVCVAMDAFMTIPYSYLRFRKRPMRFALLRLVNIGLNIGLNLFFILLCPLLYRHFPDIVSRFYDPSYGIGYIFLSNLIASAVNLLMMVPELRGFGWKFNIRLWREMLVYSAPLLVLGVAGIMNQTIDKMLFPHLVSDPADATYQLGIYGANYKIGILLLVFLQAFRFAYEPFVFARGKSNGGDKQAYSDAMKYFVAFALFIFLGVMFYLDIVRYLISPRYFSGLVVVPVIMLGELFFGIFYNLSIWYKLTDRTVWGARFSLAGLAVTVTLNVILVPRIGYMGCAVAALCSYGTMMVASYIIGRRYYPVDYKLRRLALYFCLAAALYAAGVYALPLLGLHAAVNGLVRAALLAAFAAAFVRIEHISPKALVPRRGK